MVVVKGIILLVVCLMVSAQQTEMRYTVTIDYAGGVTELLCLRVTTLGDTVTLPLPYNIAYKTGIKQHKLCYVCDTKLRVTTLDLVYVICATIQLYACIEL